MLIILFFNLPGCSTVKTDSEGGLRPPRGYRNEFFLKVAYSLGSINLVEMQPEVPVRLEVLRDIEYKNSDSVSLKLDIYRLPEVAEPLPAIIFIHGGSWKGGKRSDYLPYLIDYALKGYVTVTVSYRLSKEALFPAAVQDVFCAVRWVRTNGHKYNIDPERIALVGGSAGAHLAMMVAYASDNPLFNSECCQESDVRVKAVVNFYGPVDLTTDFAVASGVVEEFLGKHFNEDRDLYNYGSPISHISEGDPPTLTFHGTIDSVVPVSQADSLDATLSGKGVIHEYHRLRGWPHAMDAEKRVNRYCQHYMDLFFSRYL